MKKKTRKQLNISGKESCDICGEINYLETHHIHGRDIPNANDDFNLASVCPNCHFLLHLGSILVEGWFMSSSGKVLITRKKDSETITGKVAKPYQIPRKTKLIED